MMQKSSFFYLLTLFFGVAFSSTAGIVTAEEFITLNLPETVINRATAAVLPLRIDAHSKSIEGELHIIDISELELTDNHLACRLHLAGNNLVLLTEIAGHEIRLKVGTVEVDFKTDSVIRFDAKSQTLFIKPIIKDVSSSDTDPSADIGQLLVGVLNGQEFPISIQDLDPLIARAGAKTLTINTTIANIEAKPKSIQLSLLSTIATQ
jgi:hypothetical protein